MKIKITPFSGEDERMEKTKSIFEYCRCVHDGYLIEIKRADLEEVVCAYADFFDLKVSMNDIDEFRREYFAENFYASYVPRRKLNKRGIRTYKNSVRILVDSLAKIEPIIKMYEGFDYPDWSDVHKFVDSSLTRFVQPPLCFNCGECEDCFMEEYERGLL